MKKSPMQSGSSVPQDPSANSHGTGTQSDTYKDTNYDSTYGTMPDREEDATEWLVDEESGQDLKERDDENKRRGGQTIEADAFQTQGTTKYVSVRENKEGVPAATEFLDEERTGRDGASTHGNKEPRSYR